jgi:HEAT repeat protein
LDNAHTQLARLTPLASAFAEAFALLGSIEAAEKAAGTAPGVGRQFLRRMEVRQAVRAAVSSRLINEAPAIALKVLIEMVRDETAPKGVRVQAANSLLDRAGYVAPRAPEAGRDDLKPLADYTVDELRSLVDKIEGERAAEAKIINSDSTPPSADTQVIDPFE